MITLGAGLRLLRHVSAEASNESGMKNGIARTNGTA